MNANHITTAQSVTNSLMREPQPFAIRNARVVDARGVQEQGWVVTDGETIAATGTSSDELESACARFGVDESGVIDAKGRNLTPGYLDIHAHGGWGVAFDDGAEAISIARACHMTHGTTRQILSLITNPLDVMARNIRVVREAMDTRPDILGSHLEGPFLALARKGAHNPDCLCDPVQESVRTLLNAADGSMRQITIAPERAHGVEAIRMLRASGVVPAIGHCDADYAMACKAINAGAGLMTHMFNAMNGLHHREPGPIPAVVEDRRVTIELIADGFHVQDPMLRLAFELAPHRIALVTDAMAGSTLVLEEAVAHAINRLGISPQDAVEAATLTPAKAFGFHMPNPITKAPLGLVAPGFAADLLLSDPQTWHVERVWCAGRIMSS